MTDGKPACHVPDRKLLASTEIARNDRILIPRAIRSTGGGAFSASTRSGTSADCLGLAVGNWRTWGFGALLQNPVKVCDQCLHVCRTVSGAEYVAVRPHQDGADLEPRQPPLHTVGGVCDDLDP